MSNSPAPRENLPPRRQTYRPALKPQADDSDDRDPSTHKGRSLRDSDRVRVARRGEPPPPGPSTGDKDEPAETRRGMNKFGDQPKRQDMKRQSEKMELVKAGMENLEARLAGLGRDNKQSRDEKQAPPLLDHSNGNTDVAAKVRKELEGKLQAAEADKRSLQSKLEQVTQNSIDLQTKVASLEDELETLRKDNDKLKDEIQKLSEERDGFADDADYLGKKIQEWAAVHKESQKVIDEWKDRYTKLAKRLGEPPGKIVAELTSQLVKSNSLLQKYMEGKIGLVG